MENTKYYYKLWKDAVVKTAAALKTGDREGAENYQRQLEDAYEKFCQAKQQESITVESKMNRLVKESVTSVLKEYGTTPAGRDRLAAYALRGLKRGNTGPYQSAISSIDRHEFMTPEDEDMAMSDFQSKFEQGGMIEDCGELEEEDGDINMQPTNNLVGENFDMRIKKAVKESVNKVLNEMDADQYNQAVQQHPNLMGKVDPRTFANRARGVNAQGRQRNDDKDAMRGAAADSWNNRYRNDYSDGRRWSTTYMNASDSDGDYTIHDDNGTYDINDGNGRYYMKRTYHPQDGSQTYQGRQFDKYGKSIPSKEQDGTLQHAGIGDRSRQIARQMANGTGKYDPNNGWQ